MKIRKSFFVISTLLVLVIFVVALISIQTSNTTYGEVLKDKLNGEKVSEIYIRYQEENKEMELYNTDEIAKLTDGLSKVVLQKTNKQINRGYHIILYTQQHNSLTIQIDNEGLVYISGEKGNFQIVGENDFLATLKSFDEKWNIRD